MHYRTFICLSCLIIGIFMGAGCAPKVKTEVLLPAEINPYGIGPISLLARPLTAMIQRTALQSRHMYTTI